MEVVETVAREPYARGDGTVVGARSSSFEPLGEGEVDATGPTQNAQAELRAQLEVVTARQAEESNVLLDEIRAALEAALIESEGQQAARSRWLESLRNREGWIACPQCGQPLVEEVDGTLCAGCPALWLGEWP